MPNKVLGDASRLIPDPIARTLRKTSELDQGSVGLDIFPDIPILKKIRC